MTEYKELCSCIFSCIKDKLYCEERPIERDGTLLVLHMVHDWLAHMVTICVYSEAEGRVFIATRLTLALD